MTVASMWFSWWPAAMRHTPPWDGLTGAWRQHVRTASRGIGNLIVVFTDPDRTLLDHRAHPCVPLCDEAILLAVEPELAKVSRRR